MSTPNLSTTAPAAANEVNAAVAANTTTESTMPDTTTGTQDYAPQNQPQYNPTQPPPSTRSRKRSQTGSETPRMPTPSPTRTRDRRMTVHQSRPKRSRSLLHIQAVIWRFLMGIGMFLHRLAAPRPPKPKFIKQIDAVTSGKEGKVGLWFYVPWDYEVQGALWGGQERGAVEEEDEEASVGVGDKKPRRSLGDGLRKSIHRRSMSGRRWGGYPVVINFHGGGFTLGSPGDDARWAGTVVDECNAIVVCVDYRLAPEYPFPTAVEDGVDAVVWVHQHAEELGIDPDKIALSGFSSGGNMTFTVPLRLYDEIHGFPRDAAHVGPPKPPSVKDRVEGAVRDATHGKAPKANLSSASQRSASASSSTKVDSSPESSNTLKNTSNHEETFYPDVPAASTSQQASRLTPAEATSSKAPLTATTIELTETNPGRPNLPNIRLRCLIPWYPSLDYTRTRDQRRATNVRKDHELPALFTNLFDDSYLHPPDTLSLDSPYLSPGVAPSGLLRHSLPEEIILHTCEWDMLLAEGEDFKERLLGEECGHKKVWYDNVKGVPHGWDKAPNPWKPTPGVREHYLRACKEMRRVLWAEKSVTSSPSAGHAQASASAAGAGAGAGRALVSGQTEASAKLEAARQAGPRPGVERETTLGWPTAARRGSMKVVR